MDNKFWNSVISVVKITTVLLVTAWGQQAYAGGCEPSDDGCVEIVGSRPAPLPYVFVGGGGGGGSGDIGVGGSGGNGGGGWYDPRSEQEREQCRAAVDELTTDCKELYTATSAVLTSACTALSIRYGGANDWKAWFAAQCVSLGAASVYKAEQWCQAQGDAKKERDC